MLLTAMDQRRLMDIPLSNHDAAVVLQVDRLATIQNILDLLPDTNKVAIVIGNSPNSLFWRDTMIRELEPLRGKVEFSWLNELSFDQTLKYVASMPPRAAIYFGPVAIDSTNVPPEAGSALSAIHAVASAPLFGTFDAYLGQGIVGGRSCLYLILHVRQPGVRALLRRPAASKGEYYLESLCLFRCSTGESCNVGISVKHACRLEVGCFSGNPASGRVIPGIWHRLEPSACSPR